MPVNTKYMEGGRGIERLIIKVQQAVLEFKIRRMSEQCIVIEPRGAGSGGAGGGAAGGGR